MDETAQSANTGLRQRAVLVGRELERAALHEALERAIGGEGRLVLLGGEAGIGKSTLAREVAREADRRGATLLIGHCHDLTAPPPYEPWLDLVLSLRDREGLPPLPEAFASGRLAGIDSPVALFTQTLDFLTSTAQRGPVLLLLEDLHWSDTPSLELLRLVAARVSTLPMLLLVTYRDDELTRRHPLYQQLPGLVRTGGGGMRIDLRRLDRTEITALVRASYALESADEARLTEYLERHAEGNPLYAVELMRALEEQGLLKATAQRDWLASIDRVVLPPLLTQVIDVRVNRLGEPARELLSIASVIGEEVPFGLWGKVAGVRDDELLTLVETATEARLLEFARDGTGVRFAHALTREALYTSAIPPRRRQWHRQVADALMAMPNPDPDAVAHHLVLASDDRAASWLVQAGNRAQRVYAWLAAADRFVAAATALQLRPGGERERGWHLFRAARLMRLADPYRGLALLEDAQRLALAAGDRLLAGDTHYSIGILLTYTGHFDRGLAEMSAGIDDLETLDAADQLGDSMAAIALADSLPEHEASADKDLASSVELYIASGMHHRRGSVPWFLASAGRFVDACRIAEQILSAAATIESPGVVVQSAVGHSYQGLGISHAATGRPLDATRAFESSRAIYRSLDHYGVIALCYLGELRFVALTYCADDPAYRQRLCEEAVAAFGHASGALAPGTPAGLVRLSTLVLEGEWDEATRLMDDMPPGGNAFVRREVREAASTIALNRGETATVAEIIDEFLPSGPRQQPGSRFYDDSLHYLRLASVLATQRNDLAEARRWLEAHDRWLAWSDATIEQAAGRLAWSRYHRAAGEIDAATASANDALSLATEPRLPLVLLEAHRELGELATSARRIDRAEQHLNDALRLARSCRARYQHATVLVALAELHAVQGQPEAAAARAGEAEAIGIALAATPLLERCRDRSRGESVAKPVIPFGLTAREAEVLRLVAEGLTDAGVGERLFISPRTVSQHLHSIYGKLGVSTRTGAARIAIQFDIA